MSIYRKIMWGCIVIFIFFPVISSEYANFNFKKASGEQAHRQMENQMVNYKNSMIETIEQISIYAKDKKKSFQLIQNNGLPLFEYNNKTGEELLKRVDGVLMEGLYYTWDHEHFYRTDLNITRTLEASLKMPQKAGLTILNIDYCDRVDMIDNSLKLNKKNNIIGFAAQDRNLDRIPKYPWQIPDENNKDITSLNQTKNFLALLNPGRFTTKQHYLTYLQDNNYDLLIIDLSYKGEALLPEDVSFLKMKKNGGARLVFAYMSVGEAENYRSYWQGDWDKNPPYWMGDLNPQWEGNFKVKYWTKEWKDILFGSAGSYLDMILAAGFDGVFLDVVDTYEYFEEKQE